MVKKAFQRGRSERGPEAYFFPYVEGPSDARTKLEAFFNILLHALRSRHSQEPQSVSNHLPHLPHQRQPRAGQPGGELLAMLH